MKRFLEWMRKAATDEKDEAAKLAETSPHVLRLIQYQGEGKKHGRTPSPELAARIEDAITKINERPRYKALPAVDRGDINPTCKECKYYRQCKKSS